jgi:predicted lipid-binding transport protein (Tim44 family)
MATAMASERGSSKPRPLTALPSVQARILAFGAIVTAGVCGGLIGFSTVRVGCRGNCATPEGIGGITGALVATTGVAVIAVLVLRAMGEWRSIKEKRQLEMVVAAAASFTPRRVAQDQPPAPPPAPGPLAGEAGATPMADPPAPPGEAGEAGASPMADPPAPSGEAGEAGATPTAEPPAPPVLPEPPPPLPPDETSHPPGG